MAKRIIFIIMGFVAGVVCMMMISKSSPAIPYINTSVYKPVVMGFLPYWLLSKQESDYSKYLSSISYFGLTINADGTIQKRTKPTETEPGWLAFNSLKKTPLMSSLVVFSADQETIANLISSPTEHAVTLIDEVAPLMKEGGFTDLNIDIESVSMASDAARINFTQFMKTARAQLNKHNASSTLSIDVSPTALIRPYLIDVEAIAPYVDTVIFMTYDFHYQGSSVTGAVSPINGVGKTAEYDTETSIQQALRILAPEKIMMGVPLYGYEWETLRDVPSAAVIPGTGITASNKRVETLLTSCATCSAQLDSVSKESYVIYKDELTNTYHQIFYPDSKSIQAKIDLMKKYKLGGIALWALGYEGDTILESLKAL